MTLYGLKPRFQALLRPSVHGLAGAGVTANQVTSAAAIGSLLVGGIVAWAAEHRAVFLLIPVWMLVRMALNAIDGMLAREFDQRTALGAYLNELTDVIADAALYLPFARLAGFDPLWIGVLVLAAALSEMAGVLGQTVGGSRRYDGPFGKSDRAFLFGALGLAVALLQPVPGWLGGSIPLAVALTALTVVNRVRAGLAQVQVR